MTFKQDKQARFEEGKSNIEVILMGHSPQVSIVYKEREVLILGLSDVPDLIDKLKDIL